jgi:hypothetical protein
MMTREYLAKILILIFFTISISLVEQLHAQKTASAVLISSMKPSILNTGQAVNDGIQNVTFHNDILYAVNIWAGIQVIDVSNPQKPKEIGRFQTEHRAHNLYIEGNYGYISDEIEGVIVVDLTDPRAIRRICKIETKGDAFWVEAQYPYVYVAEAKAGVSVYDISDLNNPVHLGSYNFPATSQGWAWGLTVRDDIAYVGAKNAGVQIIDFSDKSNPVRIGQYTNAKYARSIQIEDNYLYIANGADGIVIIDVTNPRFPSLVSTLAVEGFILDFYKAGKYAYSANESHKRVEIINLTNIRRPAVEASYQADSKIFGVWKKDVYVFVAADDKSLILRHNNPPVLAKINDQIVDEQKTLTVTPEGYDPDGDAVFYELLNKPQGAKFDSLRGTITWVPTYDQSGIYKNIILKIIERTGSRLWISDTIAITVNNVNRPPTLPDVADHTIYENKLVTFIIPEGSDEDREDKGKLVYLVENQPEGAKYDTKTRTLSWTPTYEQSGIYSIDCIVKDLEGATDRDASNVTVVHVDRKPLIAAVENKMVNENEILQFTVSGSDPDKEDQNAISFRAERLPQGATFDPQSLTFNWTPTYEQSGEYKNLLFIMKAGKLSDSTTMSIVVKHVNRTPVLADIAIQEIQEDKTLLFKISGSDPDKEDKGKLKYAASNLPQGAKFQPDSLVFRWKPTFEQAGEYADIKFTVTDPSGLSDMKSTSISVKHINRPPVLAEVKSTIINENTPLNIVLQATDPDAEDQGQLVLSAINLPQGATFNPNTGSFDWSPTYDQSGKYTVKFAVNDPKGLSDNKEAQITVNHVNRSPVFNPIPEQTVDENTLLSYSIPPANDPDVEDTGKLTYKIQKLPDGAKFDSTAIKVLWTPSYEQSGTYELFITCTDREFKVSQPLKINVTHVNRPPVLNPIDLYTIDENTPVSFSIAGSDPDKEDQNNLSYSITKLPEGAVFDKQTFNWTPTFEQSGLYPLEFVLSDGNLSDSKKTTITVNHVDRKPVLASVENKIINENEKIEFTIEGSDPDKEDQNKISYKAFNLPKGANFNPSNRIFTWTPDYDQSGAYDDILFVVTAGTLSDSIQVHITVNHVNRPPVLASIPEQKLEEQQALKLKISGSDPDIEDKGKLIYSAGNIPDGAIFNTDSILLAWTPSYEQSGDYANITFTVKDPSGLSDTKTMKISVKHVNRTPALDEIPNYTVKEDSTLSFKIIGNDPDMEDKEKLKFTITKLPEGARFENQVFTWKPTFDQSGEYPLECILSDGQLKDTKTTKIDVIHVNRPPTIEPVDAKTTDENKLLEFKIVGKDPDKEDLGKFTLSASDIPEGAAFNPSTGIFQWTPGYDQSGDYTVTFINQDEGGLKVSKEVTIKINHINRSPVLNPLEAQIVNENSLFTFIIPEAIDPDVEDKEKLTYGAEKLPAGAEFNPSTRSLTWTPGFEQSGTFEIQISCSDGEFSVSQPLVVTVNHVNRAPEISPVAEQTTDENKELSLSIEYKDPDKEDTAKLTLSASNLPEGANFDATSGTFSWTPSYDQANIYEGILISVADPSGLKDEKSFKITVNNVNRSPELAAVDNLTVAENEQLIQKFEASDPDKEDQGKLQFSAINLPAGAELDPASGELSWIPNFKQAGKYQVDIKATDSGKLSAEMKVNLEVSNVNRLPVINQISDKSIDENKSLHFTLSAKDEDSDDQLIYTIENMPENAQLDQNSGEFSWTPDYIQSGEYSLTAKVSDGAAESSTLFKIVVNNVNNPPSLENEYSATITVEEKVEIDFKAKDLDNDPLVYQSADLPAGATLDQNTGLFSWIPAENQTGTFKFTVKVSDGTDTAKASGSVTVQAKPVQEPAPKPEGEQ